MEDSVRIVTPCHDKTSYAGSRNRSATLLASECNQALQCLMSLRSRYDAAHPREACIRNHLSAIDSIGKIPQHGAHLFTQLIRRAFAAPLYETFNDFDDSGSNVALKYGLDLPIAIAGGLACEE